MGVRDLFFAIKARDETGRAFDTVRQNLRGVDGMAATTSDRLMGVGRNLLGFGAAATAATAPILFAFRDSLSFYDRQELAEAKVAQAIRSTAGVAGFSADELYRNASALQELTRFGDEDILNGVTAQLLTFTNITDQAFLRTQAVALDLATVLDGDIQSSAIMLGKALNDPIRGLSSLGEAGISFSEDQTNVIKSLAETGRLAEAQNLILSELERQYGGQAQAAADAGLGAMEQLSNSWGDLKEDVGGVVVEILPPMIDFFGTMVSGFQSLPEPAQESVVILGLVVAAAGPAALAVGGVTLAFTALTGPVGLGIAVLSGAVAVTAALWPEMDNATSATDNLTLAMGDEITQSQLLSEALGINGTMSVDVARVKLGEARARHENVAAIIAEHRALALGSDAYSDLTQQIQDSQGALNSLGFPTNDIAIPRMADAFEQEQQRLVDLLQERQRLLEMDEDMSAQLRTTEENISTLEEALAGAENGAITLGDGLVTPIEPADRLARSVGGLGSSARDATSDLAGLGDGADAVAEKFDADSQAISDSLKGMFDDGKLTLDDFGGVILDWGDRVLSDVLDRVFDPIGDAIVNLTNGFLSGGGSSGGGGLFGGIISGAGNFFGGLLGMDTGGEMEVTGRNGIDRNVAAFRVSADENIKVVKRGNPDSRGNVTVNIQTPNPTAFRQSRGQISAQFSRAVGRGGRNT